MGNIPAPFLVIVGLVVSGISIAGWLGIGGMEGMRIFILVGLPMLGIGIMRIKSSIGRKEAHQKHHKAVNKVSHIQSQPAHKQQSANQHHPHQQHHSQQGTHQQSHAAQQNSHQTHHQAHKTQAQPHAQHQSQQAHFCPNCGAKLGQVNFCPNCGQKLR